MTDFATEQATFGWDLVLANGDIVMETDEVQLVVQRIIYRLETWLGESPYARTSGIPYEFVFGLEPVGAVSAILLQTILDTEGVIDIVGDPTFTLDSASRTLSIACVVRVGDTEVPITAEVTA